MLFTLQKYLHFSNNLICVEKMKSDQSELGVFNNLPT